MIHPTAIINPKAQLAGDVSVGPYSVIDENVKIEKGTVIAGHCLITGFTKIGANCKIFNGAVIGTIPQDLKYKGEKSFLEIGDNNIIREYVTINLGTKDGKTIIGSDNLIMAYSHIAHDCRVGNFNVIANVGTLAGFVTIEDRVIIGGLVAIHQFVRVGTLSIMGGCSKVVQDVPPYCINDGHPAKAYGINSIGLERAGISGDIRRDLKNAFKILFKSQLLMKDAVKKVEAEIPLSNEVMHLIEFIKNSQRGIGR